MIRALRPASLLWPFFALALPVAGADARKPALDPEPGPSQKPYQPADGQVMEVTPPAFLWVPAGRGARYVLQWSRSERFAPEETKTAAGLERPVHVPGEPLAPGRWFWRYGVEAEGGPSYWSTYMGFALHFVVALRQAAGVDLMRKPFFRNTPSYALYTAMPYHEHAPFGDGQHGPPLSPRAVMAGDPRI